ncbi:MAG: hypothetical protein LBT37_05160 [Lactobacillaceae bacterium]|jgi:hypothetical protein|nr:hypothetical protein [Lactobacillaceae bacterium]
MTNEFQLEAVTSKFSMVSNDELQLVVGGDKHLYNVFYDLGRSARSELGRIDDFWEPRAY